MSEYCLFDNLRVVLEEAIDSVKKHFDAELLPFGKNKKGKRNTITFKEVESLPVSNNVAGSDKRASLKFVNSAPKFELAVDFLYGSSDIYNDGAEEEKIIKDGLSKCKKVTIER